MSDKPSYILKLDRAREHIDSLNQQIRVWIHGEPYRIIDEPDPEKSDQPLADGYFARRFRIEMINGVPETWGAIIGDCLFNLRSALDHLAMALAKKHTPNMNAGQIGRSEFPIFEKMPVNDKAMQRFHSKIDCTSSTVQTIITSLQPYKRVAEFASHPLWQLHELNRIDKHREITIYAAESQRDGRRGVGFQNTSGNIQDFKIVGGRIIELKHNAIVARWVGKPFDPNFGMKMHPYLSIEVVFGDGGPIPRKPIITTLQTINNFINDGVVSQLAKFL